MTAIDLPPQLRPQSENGGGSRNFHFLVATVATLVLAIVPAVIWPGDAYWMWDEPMLIGQAFHYNQMHQLARRGLEGNFGVPYGPFPTQCYQLLLLLTHNLALITFLRAFASSALLASSMLWLARSLRLTPWFAAAMLLAPFLNWTERTLWDATFTIPVGTFAVAAYASFLRNGSGKPLVAALAAATLVPLIHLQGLPLFAALAGHALWRHRPALRRNAPGLGLALAVIVLLNWRYFVAFNTMLWLRLTVMVVHGYPGRVAPVNIVRSFFGPLLAGHNLTGENPVVPRTGLPGPAFLAPRAVQVSLIFYAFVWLGIAGCLFRLVAILRARGRAPAAPAGPSNGVAAVRDAMILVSLAALAMQMLMAAPLRVPGDPQYSFGTFPVHVLFAWAGVEMLRRVRLGILVAVYGLAVGYLTIGGAWSIHRYGWPRGILSPSINNQMAIARQLNHYSDEAVWTDVSTSARFPRSMRVLRQLMPPEPGTVPVPSPHGLLLRYRADMPPSSQVVELIELPAPAWPPAKDIAGDSPDLPRPPLPPGTAAGAVQKLDVTPAVPLY